MGVVVAMFDIEGLPKIPWGCRLVGVSCCNPFWPVTKGLDSTPFVEAAGVVKLKTDGVFAGGDMKVERETSFDNDVSDVLGAFGNPVGRPKVDDTGKGGLEKGVTNVDAAGVWVFGKIVGASVDENEFVEGREKAKLAGLTAVLLFDVGLNSFEGFSLTSSSRNNGSSSAFEAGEPSEADDSSICPFARDCDTLNPLIMARSVLPSLFFSTRCFENICFRRGFVSINLVKSTDLTGC